RLVYNLRARCSKRVLVSADVRHPARLSFPTRRSSDLLAGAAGAVRRGLRPAVGTVARTPAGVERRPGADRGSAGPAAGANREPRSEEHTSELQSRENLVCRLLLEKKNKTFESYRQTQL